MTAKKLEEGVAEPAPSNPAFHSIEGDSTAVQRPARELLAAALDLSKYAAAPFFSTPERRRDDDGTAYWIQPTTAEWWDGLREQIEAIQPRLTAVLAEPSSHTAEPDGRRNPA